MDAQFNLHAREKAIIEVKSHIADYWVSKNETPEYFLLKKNEASLFAHIFIAIFFGWWTFFIPNIVYHIMMNRKKKIFKYS